MMKALRARFSRGGIEVPAAWRHIARRNAKITGCRYPLIPKFATRVPQRLANVEMAERRVLVSADPGLLEGVAREPEAFDAGRDAAIDRDLK